jgi:hypothetical protein
VPWENSQSVPFTRLEVVSRVPSAPGVFAVMDGDSCLLVSESWNLKARLLDLANVLDGQTSLSIFFELCADDQREHRKTQVIALLGPDSRDPATADPVLPGLSVRETLQRAL